MEELEDEIEKRFGGKSAFWRSCLMTYDDKHRIKAKIDLIDKRIEQKKTEIEDMKHEKRGLEEKYQEMTVDEEDNQETVDMGDQKYWDQTIEKIFTRKSKDQHEKIGKRWNEWFDGRYNLFTTRHSDISVQDYKKKLFEEAKKRGYRDKVEKLQDEVLE